MEQQELDKKPDGPAPPTIPHSEPAGGTGTLEAALEREPNPVKRFLKVLGPGLITGASDDDPSGIGTYATAGASLGYATLWTAPLTFPLMAGVQYICAKIGMVCGTGLAGVLRRHYSRKLLYPVLLGLVIANTINAGADIGAIAAALNLLIPIPPLLMVVPVALLIVALQIWGVLSVNCANLQMADAHVVCLHCINLSGSSSLGHGAQSHFHSNHSF